MSNRKSNFQNENPNPAKCFLEWKSDHQKFSFFDKSKGEKGEHVFVELPFRFLVLDIFHCVKGWSSKLESGIYSNEVKYLGSEEMTVRTFANNTVLASGKWNDIKGDVDSAGGKYHSSIYIMSEKGEILNLALRGASVSSWFEFTQKTKNRLPDEWVTVKGFGEGKNRAIKYTFPTFEFTGVLSKDESESADKCFDELESYISKYNSATSDEKLPETDNDDVVGVTFLDDPSKIDDLPF